jgi:hypothetical protein
MASTEKTKGFHFFPLDETIIVSRRLGKAQTLEYSQLNASAASCCSRAAVRRNRMVAVYVISAAKHQILQIIMKQEVFSFCKNQLIRGKRDAEKK